MQYVLSLSRCRAINAPLQEFQTAIDIIMVVDYMDGK